MRLRLRPRHPRPAAARRPAGRVHPRERRRARRRPGRARRAPRRRRRAPARAPRRRRRRDRRPGRRAARAGGVRQPRRRPVCAGARRRRCAARSPTAASPCTPQGPRGLRAQRGADRQRQAVHACSRRTGTPGWRKLDDFYLKPYPVERHAAALAPPRRPASTPRCRRWRASASSTTNLRRRSRSTAAAPAPRRCSTTSSQRIDDYDDGARLPGGQGPELPRRAPALRHGLDPPRSRARRGSALPRRLARGARDLAVGAGLARLLPPDAAPPCRTSSARSCRPEYDRIRSSTASHADERFAAWCEGRTGYPLVDAAMAQINQTGWMHNRLRMVTASFLTKDLGIDWRRGEAYFAEHLNDYELAVEQRRLAVGGVDRLRCPAVVPHLQSGDAEPALRSRRASSSAATCRSSPRLDDEQIHAPWQAGRWSSRRPASCSAATTRGRSSTTPRRARRRCSATPWSRRRSGRIARRRPKAMRAPRGSERRALRLSASGLGLRRAM